MDWTHITPVGSPRITRKWDGKVPRLSRTYASYPVVGRCCIWGVESMQDYVDLLFAYPERIEIGRVNVEGK